MRLSESDLNLLRQSTSHYTDLFLSIFQPNVVLKCRVNDSGIARGERSISYDNVTFGSWSNVKIGATLLVGSSDGARNVGKIRIKSITSNTIVVAENSHINWADNLYLTVLDYFDVWPIFPRIIQNPSNPETTLWYKDYDIAYTNQNTHLGAFVNIGPHRAANRENGQAQVYYSSSGTYPLSGNIQQTYWTFEGGNPSTYVGREPGYVSYTGTGHYLTTCIVSGTNWVEPAYRYVSIYDKPSDGTFNTVKKWEIVELSGSRGEGGYRASVKIYEPVEVEEGSIVVIFADEWYDATHKSLGGNALNASTIKFVGYVMDDSIEYDYKDSTVSFENGSISQVMKELEGFSVSVESKANPTDWYELYDMNAKKAAYHYFKWHSNIISLVDLEFIGDDYPVQYFDSDRESLFDAVDNFLRTAYHASMVSDRQGKLWMETDAWVRENATGTYSPLFELSKHDWLDKPSIQEQRIPELSYLEYNGIAYSGVVTGTFAPLMANAPGDAPAYRGKSERRSGFALGGQGQLNTMVGNEFAHRNAQFPSGDFRMRGNWSNLDIAPQEVVQFSLAVEDTVRNVAVDGLYMPNNITFDINTKEKSFIPRVGWKAITSGDVGQTIVIPEIVDDGGYGNARSVGGITIPQIPLPSTPVASSFYSALKLQTNGTSTTSLPAGGIEKEVPLTDIVFSTDDSTWAGSTASGTYSGVIIPVVGASGTYGVNYGFVVGYPGIYRVTYSLQITQLFPPAISQPQAFAAWIAPTSVNGVYKFLEQNFRQYPDGILDSDNDVSSIEHSEIFKLSAGTAITIKAKNMGTSGGFVMAKGTAAVEFLKYEA